MQMVNGGGGSQNYVPPDQYLLQLANTAGRQDFTLDDVDPVVAQRFLYTLFTNDGDLGFGRRYEIENAMTTEALHRFIPETITYIVKEALEPAILITQRLFREIRIKRGFHINIGSVGSMEAGIVPEGAEGKRASVVIGDGEQIIVRVRKHGIDVAVTDEVIEESQWDVLGLWLRAAGRAMARHKERQSIQMLNTAGVTAFSNSAPSGAIYANCTGRNIAGAQNGSMSYNDLVKMYTHLTLGGFTPDVVCAHPLAWALWAVDPEMREIVISGARVASQPPPNGAGSPGWVDPYGGFGTRSKASGTQTPDAIFGKIGANPWVNTWNPLAATWKIAPKYLPSPLDVLVTPIVPFSATGGKAGTTAAGLPTTNVIMADSNETGVIINREGLTLEEFRDPKVDINYMKVRESYSHAMLNQGKSVVIANGVVVTRNYVFQNNNNVTLAALDASSTFA